MKKKYLYNQKNKDELIKTLENEKFERVTVSFYKYAEISNLQNLRDQLFVDWSKLKILGRIYLSTEGINAQISVPENNIMKFKKYLKKNKILKDIPIKIAVQDGLSFLKLKIKIKKEVVAYNISKNEYDMSKVGKNLSEIEFNQAINNGATITFFKRVT